jgi:hypothetical protein
VEVITIEKAKSFIGQEGRLSWCNHVSVLKNVRKLSSGMLLAEFESGAICNIEIVHFLIDSRWRHIS